MAKLVQARAFIWLPSSVGVSARSGVHTEYRSFLSILVLSFFFLVGCSSALPKGAPEGELREQLSRSEANYEEMKRLHKDMELEHSRLKALQQELRGVLEEVRKGEESCRAMVATVPKCPKCPVRSVAAEAAQAAVPTPTPAPTPPQHSPSDVPPGMTNQTIPQSSDP